MFAIHLARRRFLAQLLSLAGVSVACASQPPNPALPLNTATSTAAPSATAAPPSPTATSATTPPPTATVPATATPPPPTPTATATPQPPTGTGTPLTITQPTPPTPEAFMRYAIEMRQLAISTGDQSFGAIIVKDNRVVGLGPSRVVVNHDPTAHAEIEAIRDACRRLNTNDLSGCVMYSTSRPCRMCETAAYWARVARMIYSANLTDAGAPQYGNC